MFESFNVAKGLYIVDQPVAALYGVGKTLGVSVDVGYAVADVAPVVDGAVVTPAAPRRRRRRRRLRPAAARDTLRRRRRRRARRGVRRRPREETAPGTARSRHPDTHSHSGRCVLRVPVARGSRAADARSIPPEGGGNLRRARRAVEAARRTSDVCLDAVHVSGWWARGAGRRAEVETAAMRNLEDALPPGQKPMAAGAGVHARRRRCAWFGGGRFSPRWCSRSSGTVSKMEYQENGPTAATRGAVAKGGWMPTTSRRRSLRGNRRLGQGEGFETDRASSFVMYSGKRRGKHARALIGDFGRRRRAQPAHQRRKNIPGAKTTSESSNGVAVITERVDDDTRR